MKRALEVLVAGLLAMFGIALAAGCGTTSQALRRDGAAVEVRLPPAEALELGLRHEAAPAPRVSTPFAVTDESAGRWLTLFEMNVTPSEAAGIPPSPPGTP